MTKIALIILDTLRKDTFDEYFDWVPGTRFERAWSTSHWTTPAHVSLFTGEYPSKAGGYARAHEFDYEDAVLAERMNARGYRTRAFSANPHVSPHFEFDRGFDVFEQNWRSKENRYELFPWTDHIQQSRLPFPASLLSGAMKLAGGEYDTRQSIRSAFRGLKRRSNVLGGVPSGASEALEFVKNAEFDDQEFLFLNLMETHTPYRPPSRFCRHNYTDEETSMRFDQAVLQESSEGQRSKMAYEDCAEYLSHMLKKIYSELDRFDYVYTLSDHGELFGEHGMWLHWYGLYPELTHVPLVVSGSEAPSGRSEAYVNLIDVYASIIDIAENGRATASNRLLEDVENRVCFTEYHGISHEWRIETLRDAGMDEERIREYDEPKVGLGMAPNYYGYETPNGYVCNGTATASDPRAILDEHRPDPGSLHRSESSLDADLKDHLSDLGYV